MKHITYIKTGDYYIHDLKLPEEHRPIGRWGRMHRDYLKEYRPVVFNQLVLSGNLWTYLADINEQTQQRMEILISQVKTSRNVAEHLESSSQTRWTQEMENILSNSEEIIKAEIILNQQRKMARTGMRPTPSFHKNILKQQFQARGRRSKNKEKLFACNRGENMLYCIPK